MFIVVFIFCCWSFFLFQSCVSPALQLKLIKRELGLETDAKEALAERYNWFSDEFVHASLMMHRNSFTERIAAFRDSENECTKKALTVIDEEMVQTWLSHEEILILDI